MALDWLPDFAEPLLQRRAVRERTTQMTRFDPPSASLGGSWHPIFDQPPVARRLSFRREPLTIFASLQPAVDALDWHPQFPDLLFRRGRTFRVDPLIYFPSNGADLKVAQQMAWSPSFAEPRASDRLQHNPVSLFFPPTLPPTAAVAEFCVEVVDVSGTSPAVIEEVLTSPSILAQQVTSPGIIEESLC